MSQEHRPGLYRGERISSSFTLYRRIGGGAVMMSEAQEYVNPSVYDWDSAGNDISVSDEALEHARPQINQRAYEVLRNGGSMASARQAVRSDVQGL